MSYPPQGPPPPPGGYQQGPQDQYPPGQPNQYPAPQDQYPSAQGQYAGPPQYAGQGQYPPAAAGLQMKRRNPFAVWLGLPIITLGIYGIVWFIKVHFELAKFDPRRPVNTTSAILSIFFGWLTLGIWNLVVFYQLGGHINNAQRVAGIEPSCSGGLGVVLAFIGCTPLYYQFELNKVIDRYGQVPPETQVPLYA